MSLALSRISRKKSAAKDLSRPRPDLTAEMVRPLSEARVHGNCCRFRHSIARCELTGTKSAQMPARQAVLEYENLD
jgi:hypothetical protein